MSQKVDEILAHINAQESQIDNVTSLITDLRAQIANGASTSQLDAMLAELEQNKGKLDEALAANVEEPPTA